MKKVYLIKSEGSNYKIGTSSNPEKRVLQLQTGNQEKLKLIFSYESKYPTLLESTLHRRFSHYLQNGEWFNLSLEDEVNFIKTCETIDKNFLMLEHNDNLLFKKH